jgi:hypothetical protein
MIWFMTYVHKIKSKRPYYALNSLVIFKIHETHICSKIVVDKYGNQINLIYSLTKTNHNYMENIFSNKISSTESRRPFGNFSMSIFNFLFY